MNLFGGSERRGAGGSPEGVLDRGPHGEQVAKSVRLVSLPGHFNPGSTTANDASTRPERLRAHASEQRAWSWATMSPRASAAAMTSRASRS